MIIGEVLGGKPLDIIPFFLCYSLVISLWSLSKLSCWAEGTVDATHTHRAFNLRKDKGVEHSRFLKMICTGDFLTEYHHIWWYQIQIPVWEVLLPGSKPSFTIMLMKVWFILPMLQITFLYCFYFLQGTQNLNRSCQPTICFQWQPRGRNIYINSSEAQKWHIFLKYSPLITKRGLNDKKKYFCSEKE